MDTKPFWLDFPVALWCVKFRMLLYSQGYIKILVAEVVAAFLYIGPRIISRMDTGSRE